MRKQRKGRRIADIYPAKKNMERNIAVYDKTKEFKENIEEMAQEIKKRCYELGIPCFMSFAVKNGEKDTKYKNFMNPAESNDIHLTKDDIVKHVKIYRDLDSIDEEPMELDMDFEPVK